MHFDEENKIKINLIITFIGGALLGAIFGGIYLVSLMQLHSGGVDEWGYVVGAIWGPIVDLILLTIYWESHSDPLDKLQFFDSLKVIPLTTLVLFYRFNTFMSICNLNFWVFIANH